MSNQPAKAEVRPPFEHVEPERIVGAANAHVVRHEIEDLAEPVLAECVGHRREVSVRSELRIKRVVVDDVVAVRAAGARLQVG